MSRNKTLILVLLLFQVVVRYAGSPEVRFVGDDWGHLRNLVTLNQTVPDIVRGILIWADRPWATVMVPTTFALLGDHAFRFTILSLCYFSLALWLLLLMVRRLTGSTAAVAGFGLAFCAFPNMAEVFQWPVMIAYGYGLVASALCLYAWIRGLDEGTYRWIAVAAIAYFISIGTYEYGLLLPAAFAVLVRNRKDALYTLKGWLVMGALCFLYLGWRFTSGFGLIPASDLARQPVISLWKLKENVLAIGSWWVGPRMFYSELGGLSMWRYFHPLHGLLLVFLLAVLLAWILRNSREAQSEAKVPSDWCTSRIVLFGLLLWGLTHLVSLPGWTASRLNYLPGVGMALLLGLLWARVQNRRGARWVFLFLVVAGSLANQGISKEWQLVGDFQRGLSQRLQASQSEWADKELVLVTSDTLVAAVSQKKRHLNEGTHALSSNRNVPLLWGTVLRAMIQRVAALKGYEAPSIILDVETDPYVDGTNVIWHKRFKVNQVRTNALENVYRMSAWPEGMPLTL